MEICTEIVSSAVSQGDVKTCTSIVSAMFQRDMILLDAREDQDDEEDYLTGGNEEVLALNLDEDEDEDEEEDDGEEYDEDAYDDEALEPQLSNKAIRTAKEKLDLQTKGRYGKSDTDTESDNESEGSASSSDNETWAPQTYHARPSTRRGRQNEDSDDGDDEKREEREMEEKEVKRLQVKGREGLGLGDWGLDELEGEGEGANIGIGTKKTGQVESLESNGSPCIHESMGVGQLTSTSFLLEAPPSLLRPSLPPPIPPLPFLPPPLLPLSSPTSLPTFH